MSWVVQRFCNLFSPQVCNLGIDLSPPSDMGHGANSGSVQLPRRPEEPKRVASREPCAQGGSCTPKKLGRGKQGRIRHSSHLVEFSQTRPLHNYTSGIAEPCSRHAVLVFLHMAWHFVRAVQLPCLTSSDCGKTAAGHSSLPQLLHGKAEEAEEEVIAQNRRPACPGGNKSKLSAAARWLASWRRGASNSAANHTHASRHAIQHAQLNLQHQPPCRPAN